MKKNYKKEKDKKISAKFSQKGRKNGSSKPRRDDGLENVNFRDNERKMQITADTKEHGTQPTHLYAGQKRDNNTSKKGPGNAYTKQHRTIGKNGQEECESWRLDQRSES